MSNQEAIGLEEIKNVSDAFKLFKNKDFENALISLRKTAKNEDLKGKSGKSNPDLSKYKRIKDEFKANLQFIGNKLKNYLETIDKYETNHIILLYNYALILHILQQHSQCSKALEKLDKNVTVMNEYTTSQFMWLRLENYINIQSPALALDLIRSELSKDECKNMDDFSKTEFDIYQLRFNLQLNNVTESTKILDRCKRDNLSIPLQFYEANSFYFNQKLINAMQSLTSISLVNDNVYEKDIAFYWNDLGCIYFHLEKYNVGTMYLNRSLIFTDYNKKNKSSVMPNVQQEINFNRYYSIIYNLGVELLFANKPVDAFDLLLDVVNAHPKNPRLWLRLAECCIKAYKVDQSDVEFKAKLVQNVTGTEKYRKIILDNDIKECKQPWDEVAAMPTPTLEFGSLCIRNALFLLPKQSDVNDFIFTQPGGCIRGNHIMNLESSLLLNGAYISLCLNNYVEAYKFSEKLFHQPNSSPIQKYLARMYMGESMLMLNSFTNIPALLNPTTVNRLSNLPDLTVDQKEIFQNTVTIAPKCSTFPVSLDEAQSIMFYNLSVVHAILHQDKLVEQYLSEALKLNPGLRNSNKYYYLNIYHEIRQGKTKNAIKLMGDICSQIPVINNVEA